MSASGDDGFDWGPVIDVVLFLLGLWIGRLSAKSEGRMNSLLARVAELELAARDYTKSVVRHQTGVWTEEYNSRSEIDQFGGRLEAASSQVKAFFPAETQQLIARAVYEFQNELLGEDGLITAPDARIASTEVARLVGSDSALVSFLDQLRDDCRMKKLKIQRPASLRRPRVTTPRR